MDKLFKVWLYFQGQRIKARKNIKRQKERSFHELEQTTENKVPDEYDIQKHDKTKESADERGKKEKAKDMMKKKSGNFVSSLFRNNPKIPVVPR